MKPAEMPEMTEVTEAKTPESVLILSANMGEGHNAAARALAEVMTELWPGCGVERLDTVELRGSAFAKAARWLYAFQLRSLPWTYQFFYDALNHWDWFARPLKLATAEFFGRRLERELAGRQPDLIVSTYPRGSGALSWMRSARGLDVPIVTYIPAFHVHPYWVYEGIDRHFVMYEAAARDGHTPAAMPTFSVGAPPVRRGFGTLSRAEAREKLSLPEDAFTVLVTGGAWGLGAVERGVRALVELEPAVQVVAVCGHNDELRERLIDLGAPEDRLVTLGFVEDMPALMAASNVVVTNGAGVTVLEALSTPRPVIAFQPLPGHGLAATAVMERLNLALVCRDVDQLVEGVRRLVDDPALLSKLEGAGEAFVAGKDLRREVEAMGALVASRHGVRGPS
ncbi:MAG: MGDG synthase family glycosyltransferase [Acidimicrobiales bacterium]